MAAAKRPLPPFMRKGKEDMPPKSGMNKKAAPAKGATPKFPPKKK